MKKMISFLSIIVCSSMVSLGQLSVVYSLDNISGKNTDCCIYFYKNGVYEFIIEEQETDDIVSNLLISYGSYMCENDKIILHDLYNGYQMQFNYKDNYIIPVKSFKWTLNKKFLKSSFQIWNDPDSTLILAKTVEQKRSESRLNYQGKCHFKKGIYTTMDGFELNIKSDYQYLFCYHEVILSEGKWEREGNELVLTDTGLQFPFYALIEGEFLNCLFLPQMRNSFVFFK